MTQSFGKSGPDAGAGAASRTSGNPTKAAGGLVDLVGAPQTDRLGQGFSRETLIKIGTLAALMVFLHLRQGRWLFVKWSSDLNWQHGFIIPLFSLYLIYARREELLAAGRRTCWAGLLIMFVCLIGEMLAVYPIRNYWLRDLSMIGILFGLVLFLAGPGVIRVTWVPILFLIFAMPLPGRVYQGISLPLQNLAARGAAWLMRLAGIHITSTASALQLISRSGVPRDLTVAEACSGMRLLMAFPALGVAIAYLDIRPVWQRIILVAAAVPIAIFCNVIRVVITCWMYYIDRQELGQELMHTITGLLMLVPAFLLLWLLGWVLKKLVVEVDDEPARPGPTESVSTSGG